MSVILNNKITFQFKATLVKKKKIIFFQKHEHFIIVHHLGWIFFFTELFEMHYRIESVKTETAFALAVCNVLKH